VKSLVLAASLVGLCAALAAGVPSALAVDYVWANPVSGNWIDPAMWSPSGSPGAGDTATINAGGGPSPSPYTVTGLGAVGAFTLDSPDATVLLSSFGTVPVNGPYLFQNGTVTCSHSITWTGGGTLTNNAQMSVSHYVVVECPFVQSGNLLIQSAITSTHYPGATFAVDDGFANSGTITLDSIAPDFGALLAVDGTLANMGTIHTVAGAGNDRGINATVANDGQILIDTDTYLYAGLPGGNRQHVNRGLVHVAAGKTLYLAAKDTSYVVEQSFDQDAGTLQIDGTLAVGDRATFNYNGGTILGPVVMTTSDQSLSNPYGNVLNIAPGATNPAEFIVRSTCRFGGNVLVGQTITVGSRDWISGGSVIGKIGGVLGAARSFTNYGTITLGEYGGGGLVGPDGATLTNAGVLNVNTALAPGSTSNVGIELINDGEVHVATPVWLSSVYSESVNNGNFRILGTTMTLKTCRFTNNPDGTLSGTGTIDVSQGQLMPPTGSPLTNRGTLAPGLSIGTLAVKGMYASQPAFTQTDSGVLEIEIGDEGNDLLAITGKAFLNGLLDVQLYDGFTPQLGDTFDVLTATGGITDNGLALSPEDLGRWQIGYVAEGKTLRLTCVPEPSTLALLALASLTAGALGRRRR